MENNRVLSIRKTVDCYPLLSPLDRKRLYWFERQDYFSSSVYLNGVEKVKALNYSGESFFRAEKI